jgi:hypothetical protein
MYHKYLVPVSDAIIAEINKRGLVEHRKNEHGVVTRRINEEASLGSFGWGTVPKTVPVHLKDLQMIQRNLDILIESAIPNKRMRLPSPEKQSKVPRLIQNWYGECERNLEGGSLGLVPECYHQQLPPIEELVETNIGQVLMHFSKFLKARF